MSDRPRIEDVEIPASASDNEVPTVVGDVLEYLPTGVAAHLADTSDAHDASAISFSPTGGIAATDVQAAIAEVDSEKASLASPTFTGDPKAPTPSPGDSDTSIATTAFVTAAITAGGGYTDENARDAIAAMLAAGTHTGISFTNNDGADSLSASVTGAAETVTSKTANYTAAAGDIVKASASGGAFTVTLPTAPATGSYVAVLKTDTSANVVKMTTPSGVLLNGAYKSVALRGAGTVVRCLYDGSGWWIAPGSIGNYGFVQSQYLGTSALLWLDAGANVYASAVMGGTQAENGQPVAAWGDQIDTSRAALQPTGTFRPTLITGAYNGKPCLRFDGTNHWMQILGSVLADVRITNPSIFIVAKATTSGGRVLAAMANQPTGWVTPYARWVWFLNSTPAYDTRWNGTSVIAGTWSTGDLKVLEAHDADYYANGTKVVDGTDADLTYPNGATPLYIGTNGSGSERWLGDICEILIYDNLGSTDLSTVRAALGAKYGVTVV